MDIVDTEDFWLCEIPGMDTFRGLFLGALFLAGGSGASAESGYGSQYGGYGQRKSGFEENFNRNKRDLFEHGKKVGQTVSGQALVAFGSFVWVHSMEIIQ